MQITQMPSPNRNIGRQGWTPDFIVCHITESSSLSGAVSWLMNGAAQASYHFIVSRGGEIIQFVDIQNTAWANGTTNGGDGRDNKYSLLQKVRDRRVNANLYSVSIGFEGRLSEKQGGLTDEQLQAGVWLINHIVSEVKRIYGAEIPVSREGIIGHNEITPRTKPNCPGAMFPYDGIIARLTDKPKPAYWAKDAWEWATRTGITDGTRPAEAITRQEAVTMLFRYNLK